MFRLYFAVDGDDIGRQLEYFMLINDDHALMDFSQTFRSGMEWLEQELTTLGATIIFRGGDNLLACLEVEDIQIEVFQGLCKNFTQLTGSTLSGGLGLSLQHAYFALKLAKATGKNAIRQFRDFDPV